MLRVTIRECLLLTLVAATGLGWFVDRKQRDEERLYWRQRVIAVETGLLYQGFEIERHDSGIVITNLKTGERTFDRAPVPQSLAGRRMPHEGLIEGSEKLSDILH
jgi:hypothetical protein